jgi:D-beta-D-heptose 7-phosphate kinase/D-beta-D-heptose 1-phosphate adenosyltransferase
MDIVYQNFIKAFTKPSVLVIGDLIIDTYLKGASTRLSPEAPVPVVDISSNTSVLGGGTNTAANLKHLGANVTFAGVCGNDAAGKLAATLLENAGINNRIISCDTRTTIVKTRVIAGHQIITRYDEGSEFPINKECEDKLIALLENEAASYDAIVIADYNKGIITPAIINTLKKLRHPFLSIDSKRLKIFRYARPSLVKPNYHEITQLLGLPVLENNRREQLMDAGKAIYEVTGAAMTAVTLDEEGALIFAQDQLVCYADARPVHQPNVIGAGDTYISAFTLARLAGADETAAAEIAGAAAAVAISKTNTAHCRNAELVACFSMNEKYITDLEQLENVCNMYRAQGKKIVFTNGCFDILHSGHVSYLNRAAELGDVLIIGINTDDSIKRLKGTNRPINQLRDRMQVLAGLGAVHHVVPFGSAKNDTPDELIQVVKPDIFTKGGDYSLESLPEAATVQRLGGKIILLPLIPGRSTSLIIRQINTKPVLKVAQA